jgi:hypothetical protein
MQNTFKNIKTPNQSLQPIAVLRLISSLAQKGIKMNKRLIRTAMIFLLYLILLSIPVSGMAAEVFRCGEPKGVAMWSIEGHKVVPDGFTGVQPVVIVEEKEMTIVWGDSKAAGGSEKVWKAVLFHRSPESISGAAVDSGTAGSATMLYTIDVKRGYLYLSSHKDNKALNASGVSTFVSKCSK